MDEQVVRQDAELQKLEQQFVCVRLVQMKGVDLRLFQFDYDQSWAVFFLNADGTIYGRYGTRAGDKKNAASHISVPSFKKSLERALELHRAYPANKTELAAKRGPEPLYSVAEQIPSLGDRAVGPTTPKNCIHCHMVGEHLRKLKYDERRLSPADIWIYPLPENVGLKMEVDDGLRVEKVIPDSPALRAGLEVGDELLTMNRQPLVSQADIQWVLHHAPVETEIAVILRRSGQVLNKTIALSGNWKESDLSWRESSWSFRPSLWTIPLSEEEKKKRNIPLSESGLLVKWVFGRTQLAKQAGLKDGDVIVAVDGQPVPQDESHFMAQIRLNHPPAHKVKLTLLRNGQREEVLMQVE
ncbi:MAG: PDZ domain-containing protein [Verrucomicrobiales bacterium]|nr:PDZ domain-containing protein [Verrucomicrobiales bacterium]